MCSLDFKLWESRRKFWLHGAVWNSSSFRSPHLHLCPPSAIASEELLSCDHVASFWFSPPNPALLETQDGGPRGDEDKLLSRTTTPMSVEKRGQLYFPSGDLQMDSRHFSKPPPPGNHLTLPVERYSQRTSVPGAFSVGRPA